MAFKVRLPFMYQAEIRHGAKSFERFYVDDFLMNTDTIREVDAPVVVVTDRSTTMRWFRSGGDELLPNRIRQYRGELYEPAVTLGHDHQRGRSVELPITTQHLLEYGIKIFSLVTEVPGVEHRKVSAGAPNPNLVISSDRSELLQYLHRWSSRFILVDGVYHIKLRGLALNATADDIGFVETLNLFKYHPERTTNLFHIGEIEAARRRQQILHRSTRGMLGEQTFEVFDQSVFEPDDRDVFDQVQLLAHIHEMEKAVADASVFPGLPLVVMYAFDELRQIRLKAASSFEQPSPSELRTCLASMCDDLDGVKILGAEVELARDAIALSLSRDPGEFAALPSP